MMGCVDLIYLDPPFNSNRDYAAPIGSKAAGAAFKDTWDLMDVDELGTTRSPTPICRCTRSSTRFSTAMGTA